MTHGKPSDFTCLVGAEVTQRNKSPKTVSTIAVRSMVSHTALRTYKCTSAIQQTIQMLRSLPLATECWLHPVCIFRFTLVWKQPKYCFLRKLMNNLPSIFGCLKAERVSTFKFLSVHICEDLTWSHNTTHLKKSRQCMYFLRRLKKFSMPSQILSSFYRCTIQSILTNSITIWLGSCTVQDYRTAGEYLQDQGHQHGPHHH